MTVAGFNRRSSAGEREAVAATAARGKSISAETWGITVSPVAQGNGQCLGCRLQDVQQSTEERGVGYSDEVATFEVCHSCEGKEEGRATWGDELFLNLE